MAHTLYDMKRFLAKVQQDRNGCHVWLGGRYERSGAHVYGAFVLNGKTIGAHRAAWLLFNGQIPDGQHVLHRCDNPLCVNPEHLMLGDQAANMADKVGKGRQYRGERHHAAMMNMKKAVELRKRYVAGESTYTLAAAYGITQGAAYAIVTGKTWVPDGGVVSVARPRNLLSPAQRDAVIAALRSGTTPAELCRRYQMSPSGMQRYVKMAKR